MAQAHERLAGVLRATGRVEESNAEIARAREIKAALPAGATNTSSDDDEALAGQALLKAGHPAEAADALSRTLTRSPGRTDVRYALGLALEQLHQYDGAIEQFQAVITAEPSNTGAHQHLGSALHSLGRRQEAVTAYLAALALDPSSADTHNDLGVALAEEGRFREAETHFVEALRLRPGDAEAKVNLEKTRLMIQRGGRRGGTGP
jgi:Flp pilus assembly protein TadD